MYSRIRSVSFWLLLSLLLVLLMVTVPGVSGRGGPHRAEHVSIGDVSFLDVETFATGHEFAGTEVGGLSAISYDPYRGVYYVLSDGGSAGIPARYYTVAIDIVEEDLQVEFLDVTFLREKGGEVIAEGAIDTEGMELVWPGVLYISTEGDGAAEPMIDPTIRAFNPVGRQLRSLSVPDKFLYSVDDGNNVRDNLAFESLTSTPNRRYLYTASENALENDGPITSLETGSPSRFLQYDLRTRRAMAEYVYCVNPIPKAPTGANPFADHGLVEIQALDNAGTFLTMERSFATGVGNTILLFEASTQGAIDVSGTNTLNLTGCPADGPQPMSKTMVADFETLGVTPDNVEGMAFGPDLPDGSRLLIAVSDNNFNDVQTTQFIALSVELQAGDE